MKNDKTSKTKKETTSGSETKILRKSNQLIKNKFGEEIGPKFVFISPRVPQVRIK